MTPLDGEVILDSVWKYYGKLVAVENLTLSVGKSEFLTLLGPSGCGKTTTLRIIAGFIKPDKGSLYIKGELMNDKPPHKRNIGMVFQNYALFPHMTVLDNVAFGLKMRNVAKKEAHEAASEALKVVGLEGMEKRYPKQLSGGQQQRVALARALVIKPDVLLLDEPLSNLDLKLRMQMRLELKRIQRETGVTTVYVTHDQGEALSMSDRIVIMHQGRVVQTGYPQEIYERPANEFVADFIGEANVLKGNLKTRDGVYYFETEDFEIPVNPERIVNSGSSSEFLLVVRPERVEVADGLQEGALETTVEGIDFIGSVIRYHLRLPSGRQIKMEQKNTGQRVYRQGDKIGCILPCESLVVIKK
ncbi:MAG: ABC transporter ATP-binding protein [Candidatus Caldarchaeum sp.]|uniref:Molybdate/tungstate import ATP-binding protein WtpC n=1 Tax=Caldiarchaeum subterraneum TaxID=311458 RepID=A0A7J3VSE0_CALS0